MGPAPLLLNSPEDAMFGLVCVFLTITIIWAFMTDRIVPGKAVDRLLKSKDEELHRKEETIARLVELLGQQYVVGQASIKAAEAIQEIKT